MMRIRVLALLLLSFSHSSFAFEDEIETFFSLYEAGKFNEAVDAIYSTNKWMDQKSDDIHNVKIQLQNLNSLVGDYHGKVKLGEHEVADRLVYVSYMVLYERQPVRLEFMFYRPVNDWIIYSFSFDDEIDGELVTAGREKIVGF
ncbi:hypothetical protein [Alteromonas australica]|jgi:hypothetical protein|nr:hypothetical protein [Alteromonas australica]|tara:strand:- start:1387 stop:1818 length:432 start_codon:yes stop_codon:yes gene_type:complete